VAGDTARYYDHLSRWTSVARWFGYGGGRTTQTVHRLLIDPRAGGRPTPTRVHDIIADALVRFMGDRLAATRGAPLRVLDAGCGLGGTLMDFARRWEGDYIGVTLSPSQARTGNAAAASAGLSAHVRLEVRSYDDPPAGPYDVIVAVESLAHSGDPARSVAALSRQLATRGLLTIVDDMPLPDAPATPLAIFKRGWQCPVLFSRDRFHTSFAACGLELLDDVDLSPSYRPRPRWRITLLTWLNRCAYACIPTTGWRMMLDSYLGGLALERLYLDGQVAYRLLVARPVTRA